MVVETVMAKHWYIVHTYSGFEKKVSESLRQRAKAYGLEDQIGRIEIPTEEVVEMKAGRRSRRPPASSPATSSWRSRPRKAPTARRSPTPPGTS